MTAHWGIQDPAAVEGTDDEKLRAFNKAFRELDARLKIFTSLRLEMLDQMSLQRQLDAIGQMREERQLKWKKARMKPPHLPRRHFVARHDFSASCGNRPVRPITAKH